MRSLLLLLILLIVTISVRGVEVNVEVHVEVGNEQETVNEASIVPQQHVETDVKPVAPTVTPVPAVVSEAEFNEAVSSGPDPKLLDFSSQMARYIKAFDKKYPRAELLERARAFRQNLAEVVAWNHNPERSSDQTLNEYSDLDDNEFKQRIAGINAHTLEAIQSAAELDEAEGEEYEVELDEAHQLPEKLTYPERPIDIDPLSGKGGVITPGMQNSMPIVSAGSAPAGSSLDWRSRRKITAVKSQGACGACWAFSSVAALESTYAIKTGKLQNLSPQWLVDCNTAGDPVFGGQKNQGCNGGAPQIAYNFMKTRSPPLDSAYTYKAKQGACRNAASTGVKTTGYEQIRNDANKIKASVNISPLVVLVSSARTPFRNYNKGIIDGTACGTTVDHAVTLVGYGSQSGIPYWIIKNSWSTRWGENGYARIRRGKNICGVESWAIRPLL